MPCWICSENTIHYNLLPEKEDEYKIPREKDTYEIICVDQFVFLYYRLCNPCFNMYLDNYPFSFTKILKREIAGNRKGR